MKKTHRKGFNFFRSYFDVYNELSDNDKIKFMDALLNKQFLGEEPNGLSGLSKFAWVGQKHSIDRQVKGYEDKTNTKLYTPTLPPTVGGAVPPPVPPPVQVQVQEKGEEEYIYPSFSDFWNLYNKKNDKKKCENKWNKILQKEKLEIMAFIPKYKIEQPIKKYRKNPATFLNNESWKNEITDTKTGDAKKERYVNPYLKNLLIKRKAIL